MIDIAWLICLVVQASIPVTLEYLLIVINFPSLFIHSKLIFRICKFLRPNPTISLAIKTLIMSHFLNYRKLNLDNLAESVYDEMKENIKLPQYNMMAQSFHYWCLGLK